MASIGNSVHQGILSLSALPPTPEVLLRLWRIADDPSIGAKDIAEVVSADPALSAEILKVGNSAHYGFSRPVEAIADAITLLGARTVLRISMTLLVRNGLLPRRREPEAFDRVAFWKHSVATATAADLLARATSLQPRSPAYPAGLLHDVGIMVLDVVAPAALGKVIEATGTEGCSLEAERATVGCTHLEIGRTVADTWKFPRAVRDAIVHHHSPAGAPSDVQHLVAIVALADAMMSAAEPGCYGAAHADELGAARRILNVDEATLSQVEQAAQAELRSLEDLLSLAG